MLSPLRSLLSLAASLACALPLLAPAAQAQVFDGNVPSGNLDQVLQSGPFEWDLTIRPDTNASDRQWFHFSVAQAAGTTLTLRINNVGISAPWVAGMTPCVSTDLSDPASWSRVDPADVSFANQDVTFSYTFGSDVPHHFAYSFVYSVERADALVDEIATSPFASQRVLTQSLQGRDIDLLEITEGNAPGKLGIWVQARQHPAECGSSWSCESFLRWLVGSSPAAGALRRGAVLRVVPMLNPDGVALGNYRTNSLGYDLNREWDDASPASAPGVAAALLDMAQLDASVGLDLFLDLHTHSSELRNWVYGVDGGPSFDALERGWAEALHEIEEDFSFDLSSFSNGDPSVAKNHVFSQHPNTLSYTFEQTYHTITYGPNAGLPVTVARYDDMGRDIGRSLASYFELGINAWQDLGQALAGVDGLPLHTGAGTLIGGTTVSFSVSNARKHTGAWFVLGLSQLNLPFKGGVLVPNPSAPGFFVGLMTDGAGGAQLQGQWPFEIPESLTTISQWWIVDAAAPQGLAASNALQGTTP